MLYWSIGPPRRCDRERRLPWSGALIKPSWSSVYYSRDSLMSYSSSGWKSKPRLKEIAKLSGSTRIEGIGNNAFRLHDYKPGRRRRILRKAELDFAFVRSRASSPIRPRA